jgi:hypothetical protein
MVLSMPTGPVIADLMCSASQISAEATETGGAAATQWGFADGLKLTAMRQTTSDAGVMSLLMETGRVVGGPMWSVTRFEGGLKPSVTRAAMRGRAGGMSVVKQSDRAVGDLMLSATIVVGLVVERGLKAQRVEGTRG